MSRTESLLEALEAALLARSRVSEVREKHARFNPTAYGEPSLETELAPVQAVYMERLDRLRALLTNAGVSV